MRSSPRRRRLSLFYGAAIVLVLIISVVTLIRYTSFAASTVPYVAAPANTAVTTYKEDTERTGDHKTETILNTSNVNPSTFGRRVSYPVDGQIYTQPLYVPNVTVGSAKHNVVYVTTENDSVYAFDADQTSVQTPLWHTNFLTNGATVPTNTQLNCNDMVPSDGLSGTPVIDQSTGTMYVVAMTVEGGNFVYRLHALDVTTGLDKPGSPVVIQASVPGTGDSSVGGRVQFTPKTERQRAALTLANGNVYIGFGSFCDDNPYHGWILSYSTSTLAQVGVYNDTPNGQRGGIWAAGGAVSADANGNIYYVSGNGLFDANTTGGKDYGDSYVKLSGDLKTVEDYF